MQWSLLNADSKPNYEYDEHKVTLNIKPQVSIKATGRSLVDLFAYKYATRK